jgi:hypothetical protein
MVQLRSESVPIPTQSIVDSRLNPMVQLAACCSLPFVINRATLVPAWD